MNILIVHNYYKIPGGEDTVVKNEINLLREHGHKVKLYKRSNEELESYGVLKKLSLPFKIVFSIKSYKELRDIIRKDNIDVVHVHNTLCVISPSAYYAALSLKKPVIQTIHNFRLLCPGATFQRNGKVCEECIEKGLFHSCKYNCYRSSRLTTFAIALMTSFHKIIGTYRRIHYICLTDFNKEKLLQMNRKGKVFIKPDNIYIKPNFTDFKMKVLPWSVRKNQIVYAGRLDETKGIHLMLQAWENITNMKLVICGVGPEDDWCKKYIIENKLKNVEMLGFLSHEKTMKIIAESKALVLLTQWYEGFPMVLAESFACGTPVIGSRIGNVGNLIINNVNGIKVDQESVASVIEAVNNISDMTDSTKLISDEYYSIDKNYKQLIEIYKNAQNCKR